MKVYKKMGFTLVEVLAVIVILAIIIAIAVPGISDIIKSATVSSFESNAKMVLKQIDYKKLLNENFDATAVNKDTIIGLLGLSNENYSSINISVANNIPIISIVGKGKWNGYVACGTYWNMKVVQSISDCSSDLTGPVITLLGNNPTIIYIGDAYSDAGATATDDRDGDITSRITAASNVNSNVIGTYYMTYSVSDTSGNTITARRTINVIDNTNPIVTFNPQNNAIYVKNSSVTVSVTDIGGVDTSSLKYAWSLSNTEPDSSLFTNNFLNTGTIDTPPMLTGSYYLWVTASDLSGNKTTISSGIFNVDNEKPIITLLGNSVVNITSGATYVDAGATALDSIDGDITSSIQSASDININVIGTYTVTYTVSDATGNIATPVIRTVNVTDGIAPTVIFGTNGNATYAKTRSTTVTVNDNVAVNESSLKYQWNTSTSAPTEVSFSTAFTNGGVITSPVNVTGSYYLWILAKDMSGNTTIISSNVFNLDNIVPTIILNGGNPVTVNVGSSYTDSGATASDNIDGNITPSIQVTSTVNPSAIGSYTVTYNVSDTAGNAATPLVRTVNVIDPYAYNAPKGVNPPVLATGMTPIKWNGSAWVDTTEGDAFWYNYTTTDKQWANARTADGSMWVWIPRYAYQIATGYNLTSTGTINVKFLQGVTNVASDSSTVATTATYSGSTQTNYIKHPAFTFGMTELTGIWVAKFEASNSTTNVNSLPNAVALHNLTVSVSFTATRDMEINSRYGWGTSGTNIDTHMVKNIEWGAIAYLSRSTYGKNAEIWINNSSTFVTGCAGNSVSDASYAGCQNAYNTTNGMKASTTGNIYGIYDVNGGVWEYTAAYINQGTANLSNGSTLVNANSKYKDLYGTSSDDAGTNWLATASKKGDAIYEISSNVEGAYSWYSDFAYMAYYTAPWFLRGGNYATSTSSGAFAFHRSGGYAGNENGFRPVLAIEIGL